VVTKAMVDNSIGELEKRLQHPDNPEEETLFQNLLEAEEKTLEKTLLKREKEFQERYGIKFSDRRIKLITQRTVEERIDLDSVVEDFLTIHNAAREFAQMFSCRNDVKFSFSEEAVDRLVERVWKESLDPNTLLKEFFHNYDHGLKLIKEKTGRRGFVIPNQGVDDPDDYLNNLIRDTYKN
jgi:hypothetical protein